MTDRWVFGTYFNYNSNLDSNLTKDRSNAKWRSQYPVPDGGGFSTRANDWLLLNGVHLVHISDLAYQLKNIDPVADTYWIEYIGVVSYRHSQDYLARNPILRFEQPTYSPFTNTNPNSTNPNAIAFVKPLPAPKPLQTVGYLSFSEEKLELGYDYGAVGGMSYATEIVKMADHSLEQRNANLHLPRGRWQLGDRLIAESETDDLAEVTYLRQFHLDRVGSFQGFRFRDWSDFEGFDENIARGDGIKTQFQLCKVYTVTGSWSCRPIQKPVPGSVSIYVNQIPETEDWTIDYSTGVISKSTPVPDGASITASFEFDVPVWFESDQIGFSLQGYEEESGDAIYRLDSVFVVEQRIPLLLPWRLLPLTPITDTLDLGIIYDTTEQYSFLTDKQALRNGYTAKVSKYQNSSQDSRLVFNLGSKNYDLSQVNRILDFFWNARGSLSTFNFINGGRVYRVRFDQDELNFKFEAHSQSERFFSLAGLKLVVDN
jgi:uncharacterized protein (TIGR02217 family)